MPAPFHHNTSFNGPADDLAYLQATHGYAGRGNFYQSWIFDGEFPVGHPRAAAKAAAAVQTLTQPQAQPPAQPPAPMGQAIQALNTVQQQPATQPIGNAQAAVPSVGNGSSAMIVNSSGSATKKFRAIKRLACVAPPGGFIVQSLAGARRKLGDAFAEEDSRSLRKKEDHPLWVLQHRTSKEKKKSWSTFSYRLFPTIANDDSRHLPNLPKRRVQRKKENKTKDRSWHDVLTRASEVIDVQPPLASPWVGIQEFIPKRSRVGPIRQVFSDNRYSPYSRDKRTATSVRKVPVWPFGLKKKIKAIKSLSNRAAESAEATSASDALEYPVPAIATSIVTHVIQWAKAADGLPTVSTVTTPQASFTPTVKVVADSAPPSCAPCKPLRKKRAADLPLDPKTTRKACRKRRPTALPLEPKTIWPASGRKILTQLPATCVDDGHMDLIEDECGIPSDWPFLYQCLTLPAWVNLLSFTRASQEPVCLGLRASPTCFAITFYGLAILFLRAAIIFLQDTMLILEDRRLLGLLPIPPFFPGSNLDDDVSSQSTLEETRAPTSSFSPLK